MALLSEAQLSDALARLPGWASRDNRIERVLTFESFPEAVAFVVRVAFAAEAADHHPDLAVHYRQVTLTYWTHSEGGVTGKDLDGATMVERLLSARSHG